MPGQYSAGVSDHGFWALQSLVTDPGPAAAAIDRLPSDVGTLRAASQQLVFHFWADGDWAENGIAPERISEIDTRYAAAMFARLSELADLPLSAARKPRQRLVGCCRDFTVLFVAMARHLVHDLAALNKAEMLLHEAWGVDLRTPPGPGELPVLDELATLTGQPSPPLADLRSAYRRPEFVVPDTVTSYSPTRNRVPAVVDVSAVARAAS